MVHLSYMTLFVKKGNKYNFSIFKSSLSDSSLRWGIFDYFEINAFVQSSQDPLNKLVDSTIGKSFQRHNRIRQWVLRFHQLTRTLCICIRICFVFLMKSENVESLRGKPFVDWRHLYSAEWGWRERVPTTRNRCQDILNSSPTDFYAEFLFFVLTVAWSVEYKVSVIVFKSKSHLFSCQQ